MPSDAPAFLEILLSDERLVATPYTDNLLLESICEENLYLK